MTSPALTAIVCTHNPREDYFAETLHSVRAQAPLGNDRTWELVVIDNASTFPVEFYIDLGWHRGARIVREENLGLTNARLRSVGESRGDILVFIDDDNVLDACYLRNVLEIFDQDPAVGAIGGKAIPRYEIAPPPWFVELEISLACRDLGDSPIAADWRTLEASERNYPNCAPIGAGMGIRRSACLRYVEAVAGDRVRLALGRRGADLSSGEDNDMIMSVLEQGWAVAYRPELRLEHLIPKSRFDLDYLARYAYSSNRTWVQTLNVHGMQPWSSIAGWTAPIRKLRAFLRERAWAGPANHIRWSGACGMIDGRALIK